MNHQHLKFICNELQLGSPEGVVINVYGSRVGSFMWRVNTEKKSYAIKQLAPAIDLKNEKIITKYELSEKIAYRFRQEGIAAVPAIEKLGRHLIIIENTGYLVYPWVDGYTLSRNQISESHALKIAEIIAKLHNVNMSVPEIKAPHVDLHTSDSIVEAIDRVMSLEYPLTKTLNEHTNLILSLNENYLAITPLLLEDTVITHGDLDQLNVLWDKAEQPILIDWESARKVNPTREIVRASLGWSGIGTENASLPIYANMLHAYTISGGVLNINHVNAALYSLAGSAINWMLYNIELASISDAREVRDAALGEINQALMTMMKLKILIPDFLKITIKITL